MLNGFVFNFDRPSKTLNRMLMYEYYGYPKDFIFHYQKAIGAVTKADVLRVARQYFRPQDLTIVAVGNPAEFKTPLSELGFKVQEIDLTIPAPTKREAQSRRGESQQGRQLLAKMQTGPGRRGETGSRQRRPVSGRGGLSSRGGGHEGEAAQLLHHAGHHAAGSRNAVREAVGVLRWPGGMDGCAAGDSDPAAARDQTGTR